MNPAVQVIDVKKGIQEDQGEAYPAEKIVLIQKGKVYTWRSRFNLYVWFNVLPDV